MVYVACSSEKLSLISIFKKCLQSDEIAMWKSQISNLSLQLEQVRKEKHEVEEDRAANAKQRDKEVPKSYLIQALP